MLQRVDMHLVHAGLKLARVADGSFPVARLPRRLMARSKDPAGEALLDVLSQPWIVICAGIHLDHRV